MAGFALTAAVLIGSLVVGLANLEHVYETNEAVAHTFEVKATLEQVLQTLVDAQTGERGFVITGQAAYLDPYDRARERLPSELAQLRALIAENAEQGADLDRLSAAATQKQSELADAVQRRRDSGFAAAQAAVADNVGKRIMDGIRVIVARMEAREDAQLAVRTAQAAQSYRSARLTGFVTTGLALLALVALFVGTRRFGTERLRAAQTAERLKVTLASIGDAVVATDHQGHVTQMNPIGEALTGWTQTDAIGRPLAETFVIINEQSRQPAQNPVYRVLRDGVIAGLANHTLLVAKDGREIPIDDSAAPIRTDDGRMAGVVMVFRDITARRRAERDMEALLERERAAREETERARRDVETSAEQLRAALQAGRLGTWEYLMATGDVKWSPGLEAIHGYAPGSFPGTFEAFRSEIYPDDRERVLDAIGAAVDQRRDHHVEYRIVRADGAVRWVEGRGQLFCNDQGHPERMVGVCVDVTERKQADDQRKQIEQERTQLLVREQAARADLERASRLKDEFLAVLSHELRTPLNAVMGYAHLLASGILPPERAHHAIDAIQRNAQAQARLVESLLDLSRIMAGKLELDRQWVNLSTVVDGAVDALRPEADTKHVSIEIDRPSSAIALVGDAARLQQVLWNLLSNAVKFTPRGGRVEIRVTRDPSGVHIHVRDNGQGINAEFLPYVFERFTQADSHKERSTTGLGLGLALVREMVQAHGGTVVAESPGEGRGSTFTVTLPSSDGATAREPMPPGALRSDQAESLPKLDILIVDDDTDGRDLLALLLESGGAVVRAVSSTSNAVEAMGQRRPHVLLADLRLQDEDGLGLIRRVRAAEREDGHPRLPAIAVTAYASARDREDAIAAGYDGHVAKPIDPEELAQAIARLVNAENV